MFFITNLSSFENTHQPTPWSDTILLLLIDVGLITTIVIVTFFFGIIKTKIRIRSAHFFMNMAEKEWKKDNIDQ